MASIDRGAPSDAGRDPDGRRQAEVRRRSRGAVSPRLGLLRRHGSIAYGDDTVEALGLPQDVLEKFYWKNAERIIGVK